MTRRRQQQQKQGTGQELIREEQSSSFRNRKSKTDATSITTGVRPLEYYGHSIPYLQETEIKGRFIVIEGPDASGRSTQIAMLTKLEADGHAVLNTGLRRSELIAEGILEAKRNFILGKRTLSLFYAADFADQLENKIIPALHS